MKKFLIAIVALLYMSASTGATLHLHYCMGKLADWGLSHNKSGKCGRCGMEKTEEKDNGCCMDEQKFFKNDTEQKTTEHDFYRIQLITLANPASYIKIPALLFSLITDEDSVTHPPPRQNSLAVYIRNCVFLI